MGTVGSIVGSVVGSVASGVADTIGAIGDWFGGLFSSSGSGGYHPSASTNAENVKKTSDEIAELLEKMRGKTNKLENQILALVNEDVDTLLQQIEEINEQNYGGESLHINIKDIQEKSRILRDEVAGTIESTMRGRLVQTDPELADILKEMDDKKRNKRFDSFYSKIQGQAIKSLREKLETNVKKQEEMIRGEIENRLNDVEQRMRSVTEAYEEIESIRENESKLEEKRVEYVYKYALCDLLLDQLES